MYFLKLILTFLLVLVLSLPGLAKEKDEDFATWLKRYNAWEVLEKELGRQVPTPERTLNRAKALLQAKRPEQALNLLDKYGSLSGQKNEMRRIWLKARCARLLQKNTQALLWYSQALEQVPAQEWPKDMFEQEMHLKEFWTAVWKSWFWKNVHELRKNPGKTELMLKAARQAKQIWPESQFWPRAEARLELGKDLSSEPGSNNVQSDEVRTEARMTIARSLAASTVQDFNMAKHLLENLSDLKLKEFWSNVLAQIYPNEFNSLDLKSMSSYPKQEAFYEFILPKLKQELVPLWSKNLPEQKGWNSFSIKLQNLALDQSLQRLNQELSSELLNQETKTGLRIYMFSYALLGKRYELAEQVWRDFKADQINASLRLCAIACGFADLKDCLKDPGLTSRQKLIFGLLASSLDIRKGLEHTHPFWLVSPSKKEGLKTALEQKPLDFLLNYALLMQGVDKDLNIAKAKSTALLYPSSPLAARSLLFLARQAHDKGFAQQARQYLDLLDKKTLKNDRELKSEYLLAKAGLLMEDGREQESLKYYKQVMEIFPEKVPEDRKLKLALLAQRKGDWDWAQKVLSRLWEKREEHPKALQAEILFWLGEGAQNRGQLGKALNHYLQLAWQYPEENIWALTARYRAALIYERQGRYISAKKLLKSVVKNADRKSQKEAAEDRIKGIEKKIGTLESAQELHYLF